MARRAWLSGAGALLAGAAWPAAAHGLPPPAWVRLEVVDREDGQLLPQYAARGQRHVAGRPGARYGVLLRNLSAERLLLVLSVDGINALTGETAGWDQSGYVLTSHQSVRIDGWRKSDREVAAFEFSAQADAYATRTGRPLDLGVIGVAVFRERAAAMSLPHNESVPRQAPASGKREADGPSPEAPAADARQRRADLPAAPALGAAASESVARAPMPATPPEAPRAEARLGTGHGARELSVVTHTRFERAGSTPQQVVSVRYDSRANLVRQGVIREPWDAGISQPRPFPGTSRPGYVPDPPV
ncbi:MAG: hypothetical protein EOO24_02800 [Comamonadaceae bacterium]|nr:MAG: hypothetical protein EOO24_02800 [Comamonadaceae bacterium]